MVVSMQLFAPIARLVNLSTQQSFFLVSEEIANIKPIFKCGDNSKMENYKLISILPAFSKIF